MATSFCFYKSMDENVFLFFFHNMEKKYEIII